MPKLNLRTQKHDFEMQKLDFETQKLDLPAFQGSEGDQNYVEKESLSESRLFLYTEAKTQITKIPKLRSNFVKTQFNSSKTQISRHLWGAL